MFKNIIENNILNNGVNINMKHYTKQTVLFWINQIFDFFKSQDIQIEPLPKVEILDGADQKNDISDILIPTGGYEPISQTILLSIDNRHIKDVLRSFCHELIHHMQWLDNPDYIRRTYRTEKILGNAELEEIESEAYLKGNILFRKFTESLQKKFKSNNTK